MTKHMVSQSVFTKAVVRRIREERLTERALIVRFLGLVLPDNAETREAIADVYSGEHRRSTGERAAWCAEAAEA